MPPRAPRRRPAEAGAARLVEVRIRIRVSLRLTGGAGARVGREPLAALEQRGQARSELRPRTATLRLPCTRVHVAQELDHLVLAVPPLHRALAVPCLRGGEQRDELAVDLGPKQRT